MRTTNDSPPENQFSQGAEWLRADFHLHTDADKEFKYSGDKFFSEYLDKLEEQAIRVGVITNHNKFVRDEFKSLRREARRRGIFLLPGVELSVNDGSDGIHTLVVFEDAWIANQQNQDYLNSFLQSTFAGIANFESENARSKDSLMESIRELNKFGLDYFLIFAHVEYDNGLWGGLSGGRIEEVGREEDFRSRCLGFQKVRTRDQRNNVKQWLGDWYPAEVEGCDCKCIDDIGKGKPIYLKIGDFSFDAVKYALLDYEHRVSSEIPKIEHSYVKSIEFEGGKLGGMKVFPSPELNTFIGIRGSGKSSILESVRYALGIEFGENAADRVYKEKTVQHGLSSGGKVTLRVVNRHGIEYEVRRILNQQPDVYLNGKLQPGLNIRSTVLHKPVYFGQKDLSSTGEGYELALVEKLVGEKLAEVREKIAEQVSKISRTIDDLKGKKDVPDLLADQEAKKQDAEHQLEVFKQHGVEERLKKQVSFEEDSRSVGNIADYAETFVADFRRFIGDHQEEFEELLGHKSEHNGEYFKELYLLFDQLHAALNRMEGDLPGLEKTAADVAEKAEEFEKIRSSAKEEFAEVSRKVAEDLRTSGVTSIEPDELLRLRKVIADSESKLSDLKKKKAQKKEIEDRLLEELAQLNDLWLQEFRMIEEELKGINQEDTALKIEVEFKGNKGAFLELLNETFKGTGLRETAKQKVVEAFADPIEVYKDLPKAKELVGNMGEVFESSFLEHLKDLLPKKVPNRFRIKYHNKQLRYHSLGQRASALILFVLTQKDNDLVIIDQPEDDLDNQTIYEDVIKLVRKVKSRTQFIFATHNANFPVLGDAEQVGACDYNEDRFAIKTGSIDCRDIQTAIVGIMEGGKEAFKRRREIYQIWKQQDS